MYLITLLEDYAITILFSILYIHINYFTNHALDRVLLTKDVVHDTYMTAERLNVFFRLREKKVVSNT